MPQDATEITQEDAKKLIPPATYVYKYQRWSKWVLVHKGAERNRSFAEWTPNGGLIDLLKFAWKRELEFHGLEALDCPLKGLFPQRTGNIAEDRILISQIDAKCPI